MLTFGAPALGIALGSILGSLAAATPARAESAILVDIDSGKVLRAENANYPWYPASTTKLMTLYMTLAAVRDHRVTFDSLFTVSRTANAQSPTKMGFPVGTQVTVDNALKMLMVKSANDMAVMLAEGISGSVDNFAEEMTNTAHHLGMTESSFVNPNGLPADGQITSARDLAILARALYRDFPQYDFYWHVPAIKFGKRVVRNYNSLLGRYPGTDGMKTGFICASGFNLVASAKRDGKRLVAVVLGAHSGASRAVKAAEMLESGFAQNPISWLTPSLGTVDELATIDAAPPNLKDEMCGRHRKKPAKEDEDADADNETDNTTAAAETTPQFSVLLSALRAPTPKNANLLNDSGPIVPVVVYTGPTRTPEQLAKAGADDGLPHGKKKGGRKTAVAKPADQSDDATATDAGAAAEKPAAAKPARKKAGTARAAGDGAHAASPQGEPGATAAGHKPAPKKKKAHPASANAAPKPEQ